MPMHALATLDASVTVKSTAQHKMVRLTKRRFIADFSTEVFGLSQTVKLKWKITASHLAKQRYLVGGFEHILADLSIR